ncbi:methyltransferase domain-containing protein [Dictyobacter kobayashii]|uniref:Type 11 methyltransferase n=1 Tax=Dictyobacter kobayashii TaxID=2014872 RepID=A0A402APL5_9CHLR|nr:methyltransferase domain-containing protein [Dictyobacter kobayashii]GCE21118.1 type 11 methyltransferase [Dictyobacter kobayashii]
MSTSQESKVVAYYEAAGTDYRRYWFSPANLAMHFGYYDSTVKSHGTSLLKMNEVLASFAAISPDDQVLDAGCGYGGSAIWLAKNRGCQVVGINLVPEQVSAARRFAKTSGVEDRVSFAEMNFTATTFPDESFDVVWALESLVHSDKKEAFFREAYRLLRGGGRLIIADYTLRESPALSSDQKTTLTPWLKGWALADLLATSEYIQALQASGFQKVETRDITEQIRPSVNWLGKLHLPTWPTADIVAAIGRVACRIGLYNDIRLHGIEAGICQNRALRAGLWRYTLLRVQK